MVDVGQVTSDSSSVSSSFSSYNSSISGVAGSWEGPSFDSFNNQTTSFVSEFQSTIEGQLQAFANAISAYKTYTNARTNLEISKDNYNKANAAGKTSDAASFSQAITQYQNEMTRAKAEIESALSSASSPKLEATALSGNGALGEFINYYQYNYSQHYGGGTIASWGCGPTSLAMVLTYLKGEEITPVETAALGDGTYTCSEGTYWSYFGDMAERYGVQCEEQEITSNNIMNALKEGKPVIASMGPGHFTSGGHFIVLRGVDDNGQIIVADPASEDRSNVTWDVNLIVNEGKRIWAFNN